MLVLAFNSQIN